jgi:carboxymethylenebutenolidase
MTHHNETIADCFNAYVSKPKKPNGHAVIVLHEIFGVTKHIRAVADRFAEDGYIAYAPDLFWRFKPGIELSHSKEDLESALKILGNYSEEAGIEDIAAVTSHIRSLSSFSGKVAVAGLCLGGKLAYLSAARTNIDAAITYYGVGIEKALDDFKNLRCPLQMHFGDQDIYVPELIRAQIQQAVAGYDVDFNVYPGANHGFYTRGSEQDLMLARQRSNEFLQRTLID